MAAPTVIIAMTFTATQVVVTETTGNYDAVTNPTGYGGANDTYAAFDHRLTIFKKNVNQVADQALVVSTTYPVSTAPRTVDGWYEAKKYNIRLWSGATAYVGGATAKLGNVVSSGGIIYFAKSNNTNALPVLNPAIWDVITDLATIGSNDSVIVTFVGQVTAKNADLYWSTKIALKTQTGYAGIAPNDPDKERLDEIFDKLLEVQVADEKGNNSNGEQVVLELQAMGAVLVGVEEEIVIPAEEEEEENLAPTAVSLTVDASDPDLLVGSYTYSDAESDLEMEPQPVATNVLNSGATLAELSTGSYTYEHFNGAAEGASTKIWQTATNLAFTTSVTQVGTGTTYTPVAGDVGKYLRYGVKPITAGGTEGEFVYSTPQLVEELTEITFIVLMRRTDSAAYTPDQTYNELVSDNPLSGTITGNLKTITNVTQVGLTFELVDTFSNGNNFGPNGAGRYPANAIDNFFYSASGTRTARFNIPAALQGRDVKIIYLGGTANTNPSALDVTIGGVQKTISNIFNNVSTVLTWDYAELSAAGSTLNIGVTDGTGFSCMNAVEIKFRVPV